MKIYSCLVVLLAITACHSASTPADVPKAIYVPAGARELRVTPGAATGQIDVVYTAEETYPAPQILEGLARTLGERGYQLLDHDFLDSSEKVEMPREWRSYAEGKSTPQTCVRELVDDWQNGHGDVVRYSLRYDSPCDVGPVQRTEPKTATLKVTVGMIPAATARAMRDAVHGATPQRY